MDSTLTIVQPVGSSLMDGITAYSTLALALLTLIVVIVGYTELKYLVHSHKLSTLSQYLVRYNQIISKIPFKVFQENISLKSIEDNIDKNILQTMFEYWNLIAEEFMFKRRGWIDKHIWEGWERGLEYHIEKHILFFESWEIISKTHRYNRMLREFMEKKLVTMQADEKNLWENKYEK